jgi:NADH-quinone oxidoreductase subunit A
MDSGIILLFFMVGLVLVGFAIVFAHFFAPNSYNKAKYEAYECGIPVKDGAWTQFNVGYYLFALIFLIFDVEILFVYPWGGVMKEVGPSAFIEIVIFFVVLGLGLAYAWKKKALEWE